MNRDVRVAIIGAGNMGNTHAKAYAEVTGATLVAVVDIVEEKAVALQEAYRISDHYNDYRAVINRPDIDMVDVCVPTCSHPEITIAAAQAGKHVLCEKPMALSLAKAEAMRDAAQRAGVLLMLAFCRRYDNEWNKVRELIQRGELGRPVVWRSLTAVRGGKQPWFVQKEQGGGPIIDAAVHNFDFARYIFGDVAKVAGSAMRFREDATAADTGSAIVSFVTGDDLVLTWTWGLPKGARGSSVNDMVGPKGALFFGRKARPDFANLSPLEKGQGAIVIDRGVQGIEQFPYMLNDMYRDEIQAFVDAIRQGRPSPVDAGCGIESLRIALAIVS